ncbi:hypothetical protein BD769DRAFT_322655 [Suillus cothurnatus]|nr:hypothetical protein BD769DRAFT_322655 [Suillus cothurnatus]
MSKMCLWTTVSWLKTMNMAQYTTCRTPRQQTSRHCYSSIEPYGYYFVPPTFQVLAAILRAATKLGFDTYRAFAVKLLENAWSSSLADLTTESKSNAAEVVVLARTCGVESVLKRAFYEMVRVTGYGLGDGELDGSEWRRVPGDQPRGRKTFGTHERTSYLGLGRRSRCAWIVPFKCPNQSKETSGTPGRAHILALLLQRVSSGVHLCL